MRKDKGVITVFLSISLLLILSFFFTIIEGARIYVARVYAERALSTSMDSVMAEYYGPLWKEYHIFALDGSYGDGDVDTNTISNKLEEYMSYTIHPTHNMNVPRDNKVVDFYDINIDSLSIDNTTLLTDYQGELYLDEAIQYMKYKELGDGIESLLDKMSIMESSSKVSMIYEEKLKVEEQLVDIDIGILTLMELLDGVMTGKSGLKVNKNGSIKIADYYIKQISFDEVTKEAVSINNELVFNGLRESYWLPIKDFNKIEESFIKIETINSKIQSAIQTKERLESNEELEEELEEGLKEDLEEELNDLNAQKDRLLSSINIKGKKILSNVRKLIPLIDKANEEIEKIISKTTIAAPLLVGFEETLSKEKDSLDSTIFAGLKDSLVELKRYCDLDIDGDNFLAMKKILNENKEALLHTEANLVNAIDSLSKGSSNQGRTRFKKGLSSLRAYQIQGLRLDYSSLVLDYNETANLLDKAHDSILGGISSLVINPNKISEKKLHERRRPSDYYELLMEEEGFFTGFTDYIGNSDSSDLGLSQFFGDVGDAFKDTSNIATAINGITKKLLFQEYIKEHFYSFPVNESKLQEMKPTILEYEQEYFIGGRNNDKDNINYIISKIMMARMVGNLGSILINKSICKEAKVAATAMVGFTGLPILVSITQALIILLWSLAEALVDTCALLKGKDVPLIKGEIEIRLGDLMILNRQLIEGKADRLKKAEGISLGYGGYISMLMIMKKQEELVYRSFDLVEENLLIRYDNEFNINNCIYGLKSEAKIIVQPKLTGFKFMRELLHSKGEGFKYNISASYSY